MFGLGTPFWVVAALCAASLLLAWVMVYSEAKEYHIVTYLSKTVASICFVSAGFIGVAVSNVEKPFALLVLGGLVFGMLGDIFLCRVQIAREEYWDILLNAGGAFFLAGHLCYFVLFITMGGTLHLWEYILVPLLMMLVFVLMKTQRWKIPRKNWLSYMGYALVSGLMLSGAMEVMIEDPLPVEITLASAAFIFILSDIALATWNYGRFHTVWMRYICISLYYIAQILFVFGILLN
ncbi:MAG: lysoplasmalogenase [Lachnospiraceae bacterium]|nr:lysoplasmalogenase [Lachnospiraceae bacterium]